MDETVTVLFEYGREWSFDELPPRTIALDGAVRGPAIDPARQRYSFDHHGPCVRHATRSCCEQVLDALRVGLDPRGFTVLLNDVDADSALGAWLLLHPDAVARDPGGCEKLERLVREVGRVDALGPAAGPVPPLMRLLEPATGEAQSRATLDRALALIDAWWCGPEPLPEGPPVERVAALWVEDGRVVRGEVEDGFRGLYARARFGVLATPAPGDTTEYVVGKASEFVDFDVPGFLARCSELEPGWGGGSTIGGAPRHPDGTRSRLSLAEVERLLAEVAFEGGTESVC